MKATATRKLPVVAQTQANLSHCDSYGGCSFRDRCPAASKGLVQSMLETESQGSATPEGTMSTLAEKLRARRAATTTPAPEPVVPPAPEPVVVPEAVVAPVVEASVVEAKAEPKAEPKVAKKAKVTTGIIPPDAPGGELVPEKNEGVVAKTMSPAELREDLRRSGAIGVDQAKFGDEPIVVPEVKVEIVEPVVPTAPPAASPAAAELTLFIDCFPEKAPFDTLRALEDEIAARTPSLLEHLRKTSPKDVPEGTMDLGEVLFGRGYSALSASFAIKPIAGAWTVSTLGPASSKVLEVLLPKATFVVRGRR
jgi:hypothetical protein